MLNDYMNSAIRKRILKHVLTEKTVPKRRSNTLGINKVVYDHIV